LLDGWECAAVLADKGYDADYVLDAAHAMGAEAVIPPKSNRKEPREYDKELYKERNQVERLFNRLKHWRRVANRFDKTAESFLAFIHIAASYLWLK
jgi:transposase